MLHEVLLSLSGQPSPLFEQGEEEGGDAQGGFPLLSPAEKSLLQPLGHLSQLHRDLRSYTLQISSSHPSTICRAVATAISSRQLNDFQKKIIEVERGVLSTDAAYVGGYGIVPLSTIVGEFSPWVRRMEWLWDIVRFMHYGSKDNVCTGSRLLDHLRKESQTGYSDLEEMAMGLIKAAETAWMRQLSTWILYGQLPDSAYLDFFIRECSPRHGDGKQQSTQEFMIDGDLLPNFVSHSTASSVLFIGTSLNHVRARGTFSGNEEQTAPKAHISLHGDYIRRLSSVSSPITTINLSSAVDDIRMSLSQTVLSRLLPLPKIMEILAVLHDFVLLGRGEFAMGLVSFAEKRLLERSQYRDRNKASDSLGGLTIKQEEVALVLTQAWSELYSLQNENDPIDDVLDLAGELVHLSLKGNKETQTSPGGISDNNDMLDISNVHFDDLLFAAPTVLSLRLQPPLDLFLAQSDTTIYSKIHAYLLGIRRGQIRLSDLWKLTSLRRTYPAPWGPPLSNKHDGQERLRSSREREKQRTSSMRAIWASASATLFVLSELGSYLQGEVINGSWAHFRRWLEGGSGTSRPGTASSSSSSSGANASETKKEEDDDDDDARAYRHDPETITAAHRSYLTHITQYLFLTDIPFAQSLRDLLTKVDHFIALIEQLGTVQQHLDLETDEGVVDSLANHGADEKRVWAQLRRARTDLDNGVVELVARLRDIDDSRLMEGKRMFDLRGGNAIGDRGGGWRSNEYVPWKPAGVDRLLMSLDFGRSNERNDAT